MARTIHGDHQRFIDTYLKPYPGICIRIINIVVFKIVVNFQGYYFTGDGSHTDSEGYFQITGRIDDVINTSGHRIGTAELEDILVNKNCLFF
jgi:acetyl-CoA synthetase